MAGPYGSRSAKLEAVEHDRRWAIISVVAAVALAVVIPTTFQAIVFGSDGVTTTTIDLYKVTWLMYLVTYAGVVALLIHAAVLWRRSRA
jgi:hypothetical protein